MPAMYEVDQVGKIEDKRDQVVSVLATPMPMVRMFQAGGRNAQTIYSVFLEKLTTGAVEPVLDGAAAPDAESIAREEVQMHCQMLRRTYKVTTEAEEAKVYGLKGAGELGHQKALGLQALKLKLEKLLASDQAAAAAAGSVGRKTRGIFKWTQSTAQTLYPVPSGFRPASATRYTGAGDEYDEASAEAQLKAAYDDRGEALDLHYFVGSTLRQQLDNATILDDTGVAVYGYNRGPGDVWKKSVRLLETSFGRVTLINHHYLNCDLTTGLANDVSPYCGVGLDVSQWKFKWYIPIRRRDLANDGSGNAGYWECDCGLEPLNVLGSISTLPATTS